VLQPVDRSVYLGLVIGDDREQPGALVDDFRRSGLGHLNAVSGQNVAFVLAAAMPLLRRCRPLPRWMLTMAFLGWFAVLTRLEPSVLRATFMAALGATAFALGRSASPLRLLSLTVTALVLIDPFLVHSVGFWMSVSATLGIVLWSGPVTAAVRGPRWIVLPLSVSLAAQVGVAPIAWWVFGREAALALPMNLLAGPCAALIMTLGLPAGVLAGLLPAPAAAVLHGPTVIAVRLLRSIAGLGAAGDLAALRPVATLAGLAVVGWALRRDRRRLPRPHVGPSVGPAHGPHAGRFAP
jgi:competence protein ComEC